LDYVAWSGTSPAADATPASRGCFGQTSWASCPILSSMVTKPAMSLGTRLLRRLLQSITDLEHQLGRFAGTKRQMILTGRARDRQDNGS
jgi:hypothetical protein